MMPRPPVKPSTSKKTDYSKPVKGGTGGKMQSCHTKKGTKGTKKK